MHRANRPAISKTLFVLCTSLLVPAIASAAPQPLHFLSDQFGMVTEKLPAATLNVHLERIPQCQFYFEYRHPNVQRLLVPAPKSIPVPRMPSRPAPNSRGLK